MKKREEKKRREKTLEYSANGVGNRFIILQQTKRALPDSKRYSFANPSSPFFDNTQCREHTHLLLPLI
jgi:hypothetical protein